MGNNNQIYKDAKEVAHAIRRGDLDCNSNQLFFSELIKSLLVDLRNTVNVRNIPVPHFILHTGDDTMWVLEKGYDFSIEPNCAPSNEQWIYQMVPRCIVNPGSLDLSTDQLTNPYTTGIFQYETPDNQLFTFSAEFRRMPLKLKMTLTYVLDSFTDTLDLLQQICTKLAFVRTYKFAYLGQNISASYVIPDSLEGEHTTEIDMGEHEDKRDRKLEVEIELESYIPVFMSRTVHEATYIAHPVSIITLDPTKEKIILDHTTNKSGWNGPNNNNQK